MDVKERSFKKKPLKGGILTIFLVENFIGIKTELINALIAWVINEQWFMVWSLSSVSTWSSTSFQMKIIQVCDIIMIQMVFSSFFTTATLNGKCIKCTNASDDERSCTQSTPNTFYSHKTHKMKRMHDKTFWKHQ